MDETLLTGEAVPAVKLSLPYTGVNIMNDRYKNNILFAGSLFQKIIPKKTWGKLNNDLDINDEDEMCIAIVISTGNTTSKGNTME